MPSGANRASCPTSSIFPTRRHLEFPTPTAARLTPPPSATPRLYCSPPVKTLSPPEIGMADGDSVRARAGATNPRDRQAASA
jgi:hypothetical protein